MATERVKTVSCGCTLFRCQGGYFLMPSPRSGPDCTATDVQTRPPVPHGAPKREPKVKVHEAPTSDGDSEGNHSPTEPKDASEPQEQA